MPVLYFFFVRCTRCVKLGKFCSITKVPARDFRQKWGDLGTMEDAAHATDMDTEGAGAADPGTSGETSDQENSGYVRCLPLLHL